MAWIRLSDDYTEHPKFRNLSDGAFRLWHQGIAYCRRYQTDGFIALKTLRDFKAYSPKRSRELQAPHHEGAEPLWHERKGGVEVHDYLRWNHSKEEENNRKQRTSDRVRDHRGKKDAPMKRDGNALQRSEEPRVTARDVLDTDRDSDLDRGKPRIVKPANSLVDDDVAERAGRLVERYGELFIQHRRGAKYLQQPVLDWQKACELVRLWDDARLEKLATLVLTTDDGFIANTDRSFRIFAMKASWADDRLCAWEAEHGVKAS